MTGLQRENVTFQLPEINWIRRQLWSTWSVSCWAELKETWNIRLKSVPLLQSQAVLRLHRTSLPFLLIGSTRYQGEFPCRSCLKAFLDNLQLFALCPGEQTLLLGALDRSGPLSKGSRGCGIRFFVERKPLKRIDSEDIQRAAQAHMDAHALHSKKRFHVGCARQRLARSLTPIGSPTHSQSQRENTHLLSSLLLSFPHIRLPGDRSLGAAWCFHNLESADTVPRSVEPPSSRLQEPLMICCSLRGPSLDFSLSEPAPVSQSHLWVCRPCSRRNAPCALLQPESVSCKTCGHDVHFSLETELFLFWLFFNQWANWLGPTCAHFPHFPTVLLI